MSDSTRDILRLMDDEALRALACPVCADRLDAREGSLFCPAGHAFDVASHGYVNLLAGTASAGTGDHPEMLAARARFLESGHYDGISDRVNETLERLLSGTTALPIVDVGAGTGWLLARALAGSAPQRSGIALDSSKYAARRAASAHPRILSIVADAWTALPLRTDGCSAVLSFFAPRNVPEFARILATGGVVVVITPLPDHLQELREALSLIAIEPAKEERLDRSMAAFFDLAETQALASIMPLTGTDIADLVGMGPSSRHLSTEDSRSAIATLPETVPVTCAVRVAAFRLRNRL